MLRIIRYTFAGMLGAVIAWAIMEPTSLLPDKVMNISYTANFIIGMLSGMFVGLAIGIAEGMSGLSQRDAGRTILMGALVGAGGGVLGISFGNAIFSVAIGLAGGPGIYDVLAHPLSEQVKSQVSASPGLLTFLLLLIGRGSGWAFMGAFIGLSPGIATGSTKKMINGAIGGLIGGGIGGSIFEILVWISLSGAAPMTPAMIRFITYAITGGAIGLFIGFIEEVAKKAWLIRLVGRNEGKEYTIFKPITILGRSELVDVPVFGDPDVAENHASISAQVPRHIIEDLGSFSGTWVNGQKIAKEPLKDGDEIVIGKTRFLFRDKATARAYAPAQSTIAPRPAIPNSQHVCPFCGAVKDASGNCDCTVGSAPAQPAAQPTIQQPMVSNPTVQSSSQSPFQAPVSDPTMQQSNASAGARLIAVSGPVNGKTFVLKQGETHIGREATKDIGLPTDNTVSRNHARIAKEYNDWVVFDEGSTNGTFVNGTRITRQVLNNADVVQIGSSKFRFEG